MLASNSFYAEKEKTIPWQMIYNVVLGNNLSINPSFFAKVEMISVPNILVRALGSDISAKYYSG